MSEEYHTPKDLINHLPLLQDDQQFDQFGTGERPRSSADIRHHQAECRDKMFEKVDKFLLEMPYTDPKDSKLYTQPGVDPSDDQVKICKDIFIHSLGVVGISFHDFE